MHIFCALDKYVLGAESDKLRIICNLAYLHAEDKKFIDENSKRDEPFKEMAENSSKASGGEAYNRLIYAIQKESPGFTAKIKRVHLRKAFLVRPLYSNLRIRAQAGGFMVSAFAEEYTKIQKNAADGKSHARLLIKAEDKKRILEELDALNINEITVFPEMEHGAKYLAGKYKIKSRPAP